MSSSAENLSDGVIYRLLSRKHAEGKVGTASEARGGINRLMAEVFEASFERRGVTVPENVPFALTEESLSDS